MKKNGVKKVKLDGKKLQRLTERHLVKVSGGNGAWSNGAWNRF